MRRRKWGVLILLFCGGAMQEAFAGAIALDRCHISISEGCLSPADSSRVRRQTTDNNQPIPIIQQSTTAAPHFSLKNGTLSLFDPFAPSFNLAAEHILLPRVYAHLEAGPLFNLRILKEPAISNLKGYRLRGAIRYYLRPLQIGDYAPFIELLYTNQYTEADVEGDFRRNTSLGRYRQRITYHMEQRKQGGFLNLGLQQIYAQRFIFEFGAGLGISHKRSAFSEVPADASFHTNGSLGWEYDPFPNDPNVAAVQVYINLGYVLK